MTTTFLSQGIWPEITKAVRDSKKPSFVAVAYFGKGSSNRLPLTVGSHLVVNASKNAIESGQTCPKDLLRLVRRGVIVYSVPNLHAKVFVVGKTVYIGSNNVSNNSASKLIEAAVRTTDPIVVSSARKFVNDLRLDELTPEFLKQLDKLYQPPKITGGKTPWPEIPRLLIAQLKLTDLSQREQEIHEIGLSELMKHRKHPRSWVTDDFSWNGKCPFRLGDIVIQATNEGDGNVFVTPPGKVILLTPKERVGNKLVSFVFVERPDLRRRRIENLAKVVGCEERKLKRGGLVRDRSFAQTLLNTWAVTL